MDTEKVRERIGASLDDNPEAAIYTAVHGNGEIDIVMAGTEGNDRAQEAVTLVGAQIRYFSEVFDCHEGAFSHDASVRAVEQREGKMDEEVHL